MSASATPVRAPTARRPTLLLALVAGALVALLGHGFMGSETLLEVLLGLLILAPLAIRVWTGTFDLFEPIVLIAGVYTLYFVVGPLVRFAMDDMEFVGRDFTPDYMRGVLAVMVVYASLWCGYALPIRMAERPRMRPADVDRETRRGRRFAWALTFAALLGMAAWARVARRSLGFFFLPGLVGSAATGDAGVDVPYLFLAIEWFMPALAVLLVSGGLRRKLPFALYFAFVNIVYVSIGFRYRLVVLWLSVGILWFLRRGTRPRLSVLLPVGASLFLLAGWLGSLRIYLRSAGNVGELGFDLRAVTLGALSDTRIFETFAAVLRTFPDYVGYVGLRPLAYLFILPLPRFLWPDKPMPTWLADIGGSIGTEESVTLGAAVPHFGEYYIAFGWAGLVIGSFLFGAGAKALWRWLQADPTNGGRQAIYALSTAFLFQAIIRGYLAQCFQEWCFIVLPAIVLVWLARRRPFLVLARPRGD